MTRMAEIIAEFGPFPEVEAIHGVSFDGRWVWFAGGDTLTALDPDSGDVMRRLNVVADSGTAFDGTHIYQLAGAEIHRIDPATGAVLDRLQRPAETGVSGLESDGGQRFFCGGGDSRTLRVVRRGDRPEPREADRSD